MIFEIKHYQKIKQYKINGAVVKKSIFEDAQKLESENKRLKSVIEYIKDENRDGLNDDEDFRVMVMKHIGDLENES